LLLEHEFLQLFLVGIEADADGREVLSFRIFQFQFLA